MEEIKLDLSKEECLASLLGYTFIHNDQYTWSLLDENGTRVGGGSYEMPPYVTPVYHTSIRSNGILYDDYRNSDNRYFHLEFDKEGYTIVILDLNSAEKEIQIWDSHKLYELFWRTNSDDYGYRIEMTDFHKKDLEIGTIQETNIYEFILGGPSVTLINGEEYNGSLMDTEAIDILREMNNIIKRLPFKVPMENFIGKNSMMLIRLDELFKKATEESETKRKK